MNESELVEHVPFIYHLTDKRNLGVIMEMKEIFSTNALIDLSSVEDKDSLKGRRRPQHEQLEIDNIKVWIRDQRPLNAALDKCLTNGWKREQFIHLLNSRVFFWPNLRRLRIHFSRYKTEAPTIIKINLESAINLNPNVELCHLNSGATRPLSVLGGKAPKRGPETFRPIDQYDKGLKKLAEVTFVNSFKLPDYFYISNSPEGPWETKSI